MDENGAGTFKLTIIEINFRTLKANRDIAISKKFPKLKLYITTKWLRWKVSPQRNGNTVLRAINF